MYLALESPVTPMHFGALVVLDGAPLCDGDERLRSVAIRRQLEARSASLPELRRVIHRPGPMAGPPLWVEDADFAIDRHVREVASPPSPGATDDDTLLRFAEALMAPPLDRSRPLWRMWFITGLPERRVAVLIAVHHALADGLGAMRLGLSLLEAPLSSAGGDRDAHAAPVTPPSPPRWRDLVRDNVRIHLASAGGLARPATWRAIGSTLGSFRAGWAATRAEPRCSLNAKVGPRRRMAVLRLDAAAAKRIARAHGVGVNDVVLDLAAGGVRALLASRGEQVERLAPRAGIAVTLPPSRRGDAGNHFGSYAVALPLRHADPVARLLRIRSGWERATRTQSVSGVTGIREWTARFGPTRYLMGRQRYINLMETYLPGPPRPISLLGAPVVDLIPIQPLGRNVGLTFLASSYAGRLTVTVRTDPDAFPDVAVVMAAMESDWRALLRSVTDVGPGQRASVERSRNARAAAVSTGDRNTS